MDSIYDILAKGIKMAIYDDMVEITSPGLLPPSIDYSAMNSRQSDARDKVIAPVFKRLGIIDQWGNGLKLIASEVKKYPNIDLKWKEIGLSFQVQFVRRDSLDKEVYIVSEPLDGGNGGNNGGNVELIRQIVKCILSNGKLTIEELAGRVGISKRRCERIVAELKRSGVLVRKGSSRAGYWEVVKNGNEFC